MAIYSENFDLGLKPANCTTCRSCGLYLNQSPLLDAVREAQVFWVGLSAVKLGIDAEAAPLGADTRSGSLIANIEAPFREDIAFYRTNIVKCLPLRKDKIRYPSKKEMERCFSNFEREVNLLKPTVVFLLGKQVSSFVINKFANREPILAKNFLYEQININGTVYVPVHHPSYMLVYKRKMLDNYSLEIGKIISENLELSLELA